MSGIVSRERVSECAWSTTRVSAGWALVAVKLHLYNKNKTLFTPVLFITCSGQPTKRRRFPVLSRLVGSYTRSSSSDARSSSSNAANVRQPFLWCISYTCSPSSGAAHVSAALPLMQLIYVQLFLWCSLYTYSSFSDASYIRTALTLMQLIYVQLLLWCSLYTYSS